MHVHKITKKVREKNLSKIVILTFLHNILIVFFNGNKSFFVKFYGKL